MASPSSRTLLYTLGILASALWGERGNAQSPPEAPAASSIDGRWAVTWAQAVRIEPDGTTTVQRWGDGVLELTVSRDSVTGRWAPGTAGSTPVAWTLRGSFTDGHLMLVARDRTPADPRLAQIEALVFHGRIEGGTLTGRMRILGPARGTPVDRPWRAERIP